MRVTAKYFIFLFLYLPIRDTRTSRTFCWCVLPIFRCCCRCYLPTKLNNRISIFLFFHIRILIHCPWWKMNWLARAIPIEKDLYFDLYHHSHNRRGISCSRICLAHHKLNAYFEWDARPSTATLHWNFYQSNMCKLENFTQTGHWHTKRHCTQSRKIISCEPFNKQNRTKLKEILKTSKNGFNPI